MRRRGCPSAAPRQQRRPDRATRGVDLVRSLYLHEVGHAMGLNHMTDRMQMMYAGHQNDVPTRYGAGDTAGLRRFASLPCFVPRG